MPSTPFIYGKDTLGALDRQLRMTLKYGADELYQRLLSIIQADWPSTLRDWDRVQEDVTTRCPDPCPVIALMRTHGRRHELGSLFYYLFRIHHQAQLSSLPMDDMELYLCVVVGMPEWLLTEGVVLEQWHGIGGCFATVCQLQVMVIWHHVLSRSFTGLYHDPLHYIADAITSLEHIREDVDASKMCVPCRLLLADTFRGFRRSIFASLIQTCQ
jgi:hypothetical protein